MQKAVKYKAIVIACVLCSLFLNIWGNSWGLPFRWHSDEKVANVLHMLHQRSLVDTHGFFFQPTGYHLVLMMWLIPFLIFIQLSGYPIEALREAASHSWTSMAAQFPDFASGIYIYSRILSALLGAATVWLVYLLANRIYGKKEGVFSALFLSVCMGFIAVNHFAKYSSLVNFLMVLNMLIYCNVFDSKKLAEKIKLCYIASFLTGFAVSVKFNAALLILPLAATYVFNFWRNTDKDAPEYTRGKIAAITCYSAFFFALGVFLFTPSLMLNFKSYYDSTSTLMGEGASGGSNFLHGIKMSAVAYINYFFELLTMVGAPLFILSITGMSKRLTAIKELSKKEILIVSFLILYWLIMIPISQDPFPQPKYIVGIIPFLMLLAGKTMADMLEKHSARSLKWALFFVVLLFSFLYSFKANTVFVSADTRYASTAWIRTHIPQGSKIEIFNQMHLLFEESLINDYEFLFLGKSSREAFGRSLPRWITIEGRQAYIEQLNKDDSSSDYIIVNVNYLDELYTGGYLSYLPGVSDYMAGLFEGRKNFTLIAKFIAENQRIVHGMRGGIILPEDLLWTPIPDHESVSPSIYIFKKKT